MRSLALLACFAVALPALAAPPDLSWVPRSIQAIQPELDALYVELHQSPELSLHEARTAAKMAAGLRKLGFEVTAGVGGTGVVGVLRNGAGPTVLVRADMDALPVEEKTGLPFASKVVAKDDAGVAVPVMHACGHDVHMAGWIGAATALAKNRDRWRGTIVMVGQPAEERGLGAQAMLKDGLFSRFPKPDFAVAIHVTAELPAGMVAGVPGFALANSDSVDVTIFGKGGHGARPHKAVDPVVIGAKIVLGLQTLVSRETDPADPAVVTVGSFHAGTKHNIIPDQARLQLTVRSYKDEVRQHLLDGIVRIAKAEAAAANAPREPEVTFAEGLPSTYNDPDFTARLTSAIARTLGEGAVGKLNPIMGAEDFAHYGRAGAKASILWVGAAEPSAWKKAKATGVALPNTHSALFAPDKATVKAAAAALAISAAEALSAP